MNNKIILFEIETKTQLKSKKMSSLSWLFSCCTPTSHQLVAFSCIIMDPASHPTPRWIIVSAAKVIKLQPNRRMSSIFEFQVSNLPLNIQTDHLLHVCLLLFARLSCPSASHLLPPCYPCLAPLISLFGFPPRLWH